FTTLATACVVADESRLRRLLVNRDRAARAARLRARAAERMAAEPMQRSAGAAKRSGAPVA
ncbi:MAG TPA: hypothetical protein VFE13_19275, partial [Caulobacteraceae bacterium]|nr:hypothetical protein [Caulobacteraceae bacterium]